MIGSIGIDMQGSRAAVCLMEWAGGQVRQGPVGDGRRILIPVAVTATSWGSPAAEAVLGALRTGGRPADMLDMLYAWQQDPWSPEFLAGLHRRLLDFLGQAQAEGFRSHQVIVCADSESGADWATAAELLDQAGLPGTEPVRPADALLCRWLSGTPEPPSGPVLAVACGETATMVGLYSVTGAGAIVVHTDRQTRLGAGPARWVVEIAGDALRQCRPDVPARALLGLLDGVDEFAAMARASTGDAWVEWVGPLSQYMFEPLRASRSELAGRATVADFTGPVVNAVYGALAGVPGRVTLLVGGPGAAWPFVADALAGLGTVWKSGDPTLDLAYGACWWEHYRRGFRRDDATESTERAPVLGAGPEGAGPVRESPAAVRAEPPAPVVPIPLDVTGGAGGEQDADRPWDRAPAPAAAAPGSAEPAGYDDVDPWER